MENQSFINGLLKCSVASITALFHNGNGHYITVAVMAPLHAVT